MSVEFHDGTHKLYQTYAQSRKWNDSGLLQLNPANQWDQFLINHNTTEKLTELLNAVAVTNCLLPDYVSKLGQYRDSKDTGFIIIKGLHQWQKLGRTANYKLHVTFGLDGRLWHLYARYTASTNKIAFDGSATAGEKVTGEDHEAFATVGGKKKKKK